MHDQLGGGKNKGRLALVSLTAATEQKRQI